MVGSCYVVTGAASGIGEAVAKHLLKGGEKVVVLDLNRDALRQKYEAEPNAVCVAVDLLGADALQVTIDGIKAKFATVKGFVHCAGFVRTAPLGYILPKDAEDLFRVHSLFPMQFLGWMAKKANHQTPASCVLISSMACHEGDRGNVAYAAAKGGVEGMLKCVAAELAVKGIRVNALVLGVVDTPLAHTVWMDASSVEQLETMKAAYPFGFGTPQKVADIVKFFLGEESSWITGQTLICDGGHSLV